MKCKHCGVNNSLCEEVGKKIIITCRNCGRTLLEYCEEDGWVEHDDDVAANGRFFTSLPSSSIFNSAITRDNTHPSAFFLYFLLHALPAETAPINLL